MSTSRLYTGARLLLVSSLLAACTAEDETSLGLQPSALLTPGYTESYSLDGTDAYANEYAGSFDIETQPQTTIDGIDVIPVRYSFSIANKAGGVPLVRVLDQYYAADSSELALLGTLNYAGNYSELDTSPGPGYEYSFPASAAPGASGLIGLYRVYDSGDDPVGIEALEWSVQEEATGSSATFTLGYFNLTGDLLSTEELVFHADSDGERSSMNFDVDLIDMLTFGISTELHLVGTRIH
jgi:hypothetical protein